MQNKKPLEEKLKGLKVGFPITNETVEAVVTGLDVNSKDRAIAVCGAGDQALGIAEYASRVLTLDARSMQIEFAKIKHELVRSGDYARFRAFFDEKAQHTVANRRYFSTKRLNNVRKKLPRIEYMHEYMALLEAPENTFTKAYLSNIIGYPLDGISDTARVIPSSLMRLMPAMAPGSLIYISNGDWVSGIINHYPNIRASLEIHQGLTRAARSKEKNQDWTPSVYRKVA